MTPTTETWWVISEEGLYLTPDSDWDDDISYALRFETRQAAEDEAAEWRPAEGEAEVRDIAQVVECTLTCRPVGLRWSAGQHYSMLVDGDEGAAIISEGPDAWCWYLDDEDSVEFHYVATEDEARAAAEIAVRAKWGKAS